MPIDTDVPATEGHNARSADLDTMSAAEIVAVFAHEDRRAVEAVIAVAEHVATAVGWVAEAFRSGGRLLYVGAGTSGRLGVLDASECPPTFGVDPGEVVGIIAGGDGALRTSAEGAEDDADAGAAAMASHSVAATDIVVGIAASGRTPYVLGALCEARRRGAKGVLLSCAPPRDSVREYVDLFITPLTGAEVLSGSTRLKAGTATKLILNQITTGAMVLAGKAYGNRMVDVKPVNAKLRRRAVGLVSELASVPVADAREALDVAGGNVKSAVVALVLGVADATASELITSAGGSLRRALTAGRR
jgi:N-acetylmuramic acid 6-phosphate etherase